MGWKESRNLIYFLWIYDILIRLINIYFGIDNVFGIKLVYNKMKYIIYCKIMLIIDEIN